MKIGYRYLVSVKTNNSVPQCKYPRVKVQKGIRCNKYYFEDNQFKKITYPLDLLFRYVNEDDKIENDIIDIQNDWPGWYSIKVTKSEFPDRCILASEEC
jgi:hypothetical protein